MKKLAIISSYSEACGIASYTEALRKEFEKHFEVVIISLNIDLLNRENATSIKSGDEHIQDIANKLADFDYINIQFEPGIFGRTAKIIYNRIKKLIFAAPNLIFTLHSFHIKSNATQKSNLKVLLRGKFADFLKNSLLILHRNSYAKLYEKILSDCKKNKAAIVVHNRREKKLIQVKHRYDSVFDFPLTFLSEDEIQRYSSAADKSVFKQKYGVAQDKVTIGLFGYISKYKGHHVAVKALSYLPENYNLMIFGSQHPQSITEHQEIDPYLESLLNDIEDPANNESLVSRVHFCGALDDEKFINALLCCDYAVLPYLEVHQSSSGIASLALETHANAIFSNSLAFKELAKYAVNCFRAFDIGNYLELANAIKTYNPDDYQDGLKNYSETYNVQNNVLFYKKIFEGSN